MSFKASAVARYQPADEGESSTFIYRKRAPIADWQDPAAGKNMGYSTTRFTARDVDDSDDDVDFEDQAPVLRSAIAALTAQEDLIQASISRDESRRQGPSDKTQALLAGYQSQGAELQHQVERYAGEHYSGRVGLWSAHACLSSASDAGKTASSAMDKPVILTTQLEELESKGQQLQAKANALPQPRRTTSTTTTTIRELPSKLPCAR
jgi:hypothetical protein